MRRLISVLILAGCLAVIAACGSSNGSNATTTATTLSNVVLGPATSVTSPAFRAYLLHSLRYPGSGVSNRDAQNSAACGIKKFLSQGIKTYGDFTNPRNAARLQKDGLECARQTGFRK